MKGTTRTQNDFRAIMEAKNKQREPSRAEGINSQPAREKRSVEDEEDGEDHEKKRSKVE